MIQGTSPTVSAAPPIGLRTEHSYLADVKATTASNLRKWRTLRVAEITTAINSYASVGKAVPKEWHAELRRLTK